MTAPVPSISVEELSVRVGQKRLIGPVSFEVEAGETLVIMGETGAGKSLIAQAILGTLPSGLSAEGEIHLSGQRVDDLAQRQRAAGWGRHIAMLPQEPRRALDPLMRSAAQVAEAHRYVAGRSASEARKAAEADFADLGLEGAEKRLPGALSGGMAQRVAFAASAAGGAPILIADEPTKGLDTERAAAIVEMLAGTTRSGGTLVVITHDIVVARQLGGRMMVLKHGQLVEQGATGDVLAAPTKAYTKELLAADPSAWPVAWPARRGEPVLDVQDLAVARDGRTLVDGFSLTLHAGARAAITGPSGIGKTSLLDVLAGLIPPASGTVRRASSVSNTGIQKLYQDPPTAFPARVKLGRNLRDVARLHSVDWLMVQGWLEGLGIGPELLDRYPDTVSGGELQRISIARALTARPSVLLADEPTSRLDPITQRETMEMLAEIASQQAVAVLLVTHDLRIAERWAEHVIDLGRYSTALNSDSSRDEAREVSPEVMHKRREGQHETSSSWDQRHRIGHRPQHAG